LPINTLCGGFDVALGGFAPSFCILHSPFCLRRKVALMSSWVALRSLLSGFSFQLSAFQLLQ
jgi:hypothetical protein